MTYFDLSLRYLFYFHFRYHNIISFLYHLTFTILFTLFHNFLFNFRFPFLFESTWLILIAPHFCFRQYSNIYHSRQSNDNLLSLSLFHLTFTFISNIFIQFSILFLLHMIIVSSTDDFHSILFPHFFYLSFIFLLHIFSSLDLTLTITPSRPLKYLGWGIWLGTRE